MNVLCIRRAGYIGSHVCKALAEAGHEPIRCDNLSSGHECSVSLYGRTKLASERMRLEHCAAYGLDAVVLRYFDASGADAHASIGEDHDAETQLSPLALDVVAGRRPHMDIYGADAPLADGTCIGDFVDVCDPADAHVHALEFSEIGVMRAVNLGDGRGQSVLEVLIPVRLGVGCWSQMLHRYRRFLDGRRAGQISTRSTKPHCGGIAGASAA